MNNSPNGSEKDNKDFVQAQVLESKPEPVAVSSSSIDRFSKKEKWVIVLFTAFAGLFNPLTATIYYPAIPLLTKAFHKSTELINLTVTTYVVLQGIAPMIWGPISDHYGRRPVYALCLIILSLSCIGLALVPTSNYGLLMGLRCIQACGSASTIAIGAGVIGDISSRAERGGFFGIFSLGPTAGPALGPVIGGALAGHFGWRSTFWFVCIASTICGLVIVLFQPETLPHIVDSGRDQIFILYKPLIPIIGKKVSARGVKATSKVPKNPFILFRHLDVFFLLYVNAVSFATFYAIVVTISSLMFPAYPFLTETTLGFVSCQRFKRRVQTGLSGSLSGVDLSREENFPLEWARLRLTPYIIVITTAACAGYGWCLQAKVNIAVSLILQFIIGCLAIVVTTSTTTLLIDLVPGQSSSVSACSNLLRCVFSAILVSVIDPIAKAIGTGWTFVLISVLTVTSLPLVLITIKIGPKRRVSRQQKREELTQKATVEVNAKV
ncbi:major facilitator superfamily domain-containing protein [Gymnopilus junonius]|uniref:Major facilitator superfamily domain-containing protein n=1 Tax=Gymnopilus junonius TaxID=109634 RepID=A0A9P5TJS7_GYMJU|nr:major facilitator superfamily domain-containing protein [Gymnopilus junonius]